MKYGVPTQKKIYLKGMSGEKPLVPVQYDRLEEMAEQKLSAEAFAYIAGGAGTGRTIKANRQAFEDYMLQAEMMSSVPDVDLSISLLDKKYKTPLFAAPIGVLELAHREADRGVAKACAHLDIPMIFSNQASVDMETCAGAMGDHPRWFQLYWSKSDELVESLVQRAERCGCEAIVVTLDTTSLGWRPMDLDLAYLPFLRGMGLAQYSSDPIFQSIVEHRLQNPSAEKGEAPAVNLTTVKNLIRLCHHYPGGFFNNLFSKRALTAVRTFIDIYMRPELRWSDFHRLREMTSLPIWAKGIHAVEDVEKAVKAGVSGIIVSNHGGRQIDGGEGALHALDRIAKQYKGEISILFDSGIRSAADVIIAMALGADGVLLGRPYVYGLTLAGEKGVELVFRFLLAEIELQLSLMGISAMKELSRNHLIFR